MTRVILFLLLPLFSVPASAQDWPTHDTALWNRFHDFETRLLAQPVRTDAAAALNEYRLVWVEHNNGYHTSLSPGDSTITLESMLPTSVIRYPGGTREEVAFRGERYATMVRDVPAGMLDLTRWFFER